MKTISHLCCCLFLMLSFMGTQAQNGERKFSVFFDNNIYELGEKQHKLLDSIKGLANKDSLDVHIKGYTNSIGAKKYNLELSSRRAENVKAALREFTVISSNGYGELNGVAANNRRVDILVHFKKNHIVIEGEIREEPVQLVEGVPTLATLLKPKKGEKITLEGIRFYADRDIIMDESRKPLDELVTFLKDNPQVKFRLIGHICCGDNDDPARDVINVRTGENNLSEARARALHNFLAKKGIDTKRMRYIGMAYRYPTGKGDTYDRRVEIEITSVD